MMFVDIEIKFDIMIWRISGGLCNPILMNLRNTKVQNVTDDV